MGFPIKELISALNGANQWSCTQCDLTLLPVYLKFYYYMNMEKTDMLGV